MPDDLTERFCAEYFTLNSISEARQHRARAVLALLGDWLDKPIEQATDKELRGWLCMLLEDHQPSTVAWYLKMVKPFFKWCWRSRIIDADAWMRINDVSPPRGYGNSAPRPYSTKELRQLWAQLDAKYPYTTKLKLTRWRNGTGRWRSVRKHAMRLQLEAIIELALVCGLRRNEIYQLSIDDVHWDNKYVVVHGKRVDHNPKVREVPYPESTRKAIQAWFRIRGIMGPPPEIGLWLSVTGPDPLKALSASRMARLLSSFGDWELHRLRHTCATERLRAGMKLEELRDFLGHANIHQTLAYAQLVREDVHRAAERSDAAFQRAIRPAA